MDNAAALIIDTDNNVSEPQLYGTLRMHAVYNVHTGWKLQIHTACLPSLTSDTLQCQTISDSSPLQLHHTRADGMKHFAYLPIFSFTNRYRYRC